MREIKFRAWDRATREYWNIDKWHFEDEYLDLIEPGVSICDSHIKRIWRKRGDVELMQYTGLKDMYGRDIYEGDIVSFGSVWDNGDNEDLDEEIHIGVVEYDPHYTVYNVNCEESGERRFLLMDVVNYDGFGAIGNIHENPELLEAD